MRTKRALVISAILGAIVLIPVLVIVTLGIYGTSLGGSVSAQGATGAQITLLPARGSPGESVTIQGRGWPPKGEIIFYVARGDTAEDAGARLRLGTIEASRAGTFEMQTSVPRHLVALGTEQIFFQAEVEGGDSDIYSVSPVRFALDPYQNTLRVAVADSDRAIPLDGALVEIRDRFGQLVAAVRTDSEGIVEIAGISPGEYVLAAAKIDYAAGSKSQVFVSELGTTEISLSLRYEPGQRLFGLAYAQFEGGPPLIGGVDRASGLVVEQPLAVIPGRFGPIADLRMGVFYEFLLHVNGEAEQEILLPLLSLEGAGRLAAGYGAGNSTITRYAGESATGTVVISSAIGFPAGQVSAIVTLDPATGRVVFRREVPISSLTPVISSDGTRLYVGDWLTGNVRVLDAANGDTLATHPNVVEAVRQVLVDGEDGLLVLEEQTGTVRSLNPETGVVGEPLLVVPSAQGMALANNGNLLLIGSDRWELIVANPDTGELLEVVALQSPAGFIWPDRDGDFLIIGYRGNRQEVTFQVLDAQTYELIRTAELPLE